METLLFQAMKSKSPSCLSVFSPHRSWLYNGAPQVRLMGPERSEIDL